MLGKCKGIHAILAIVIIVLALWPGIIGAVASKWVIVVAAALVLLHSGTCSACGSCEECGVDMKKASRKKRK